MTEFEVTKNQEGVSDSNDRGNKRNTRVYEHRYYDPPPKGPYQGPYPYKKLYRSTSNKWLGGVCGGIAEHFNKDPVLIRILWVILTIFSFGVGVIAYILFWIFVEKYPTYYELPPRTRKSSRRRSVHYHHYYD
jgi:phage shock protein PspC (stress-responsive transcriptional regulator)